MVKSGFCTTAQPREDSDEDYALGKHTHVASITVFTQEERQEGGGWKEIESQAGQGGKSSNKIPSHTCHWSTRVGGGVSLEKTYLTNWGRVGRWGSKMAKFELILSK